LINHPKFQKSVSTKKKKGTPLFQVHLFVSISGRICGKFAWKKPPGSLFFPDKSGNRYTVKTSCPFHHLLLLGAHK